MADSNEHTARKRELEEKKQRVAELRAQREKKQRENGRTSILGDRECFMESRFYILILASRPTMTTLEIRKLMAEIGVESRDDAPNDPSSTHSMYRECNGDGPV